MINKYNNDYDTDNAVEAANVSDLPMVYECPACGKVFNNQLHRCPECDQLFIWKENRF